MFFARGSYFPHRCLHWQSKLASADDASGTALDAGAASAVAAASRTAAASSAAWAAAPRTAAGASLLCCAAPAAPIASNDAPRRAGCVLRATSAPSSALRAARTQRLRR
jgi:hypothetical protein